MDLSFTKSEKAMAKVRRLERVQEAIAWPKGTQEEKIKQIIWEANGYEVSLSKPGKEAAEDYIRCKYKDGHSGNNPNDMLPLVSYRGKFSKNAAFTDIFGELIRVTDITAGELLGALLFRSAYMLDHVKDENGHWRYVPNKEALSALSKIIPQLYGVSMEAFLHYLDALGWNEDVKYSTLGHDIGLSVGRVNNFLTSVRIVAFAIHKEAFHDLVGGFSHPPTGLSAISQKKAMEAFPLLILK